MSRSDIPRAIIISWGSIENCKHKGIKVPTSTCVFSRLPPHRRQEPSEVLVPFLQRRCPPHGKPVGCFCADLRTSLQRSKPPWPDYDSCTQSLIWPIS